MLGHCVDQRWLARLDLRDRPLERRLEIVGVLDGTFGPPAHRAGEAGEVRSRSKQIHAEIGTSLGVALANKGTGRLVVDLQPDGDLMYDGGALWISAKYQIPLLIVMYNNRSYYNDWNHQIVMARTRGTDLSRAHIGMDLFGPAPDFAGLARSMGWWAEGPIEKADDLQPALQRAVVQVKNGKPALVDAVTQHR